MKTTSTLQGYRLLFSRESVDQWIQLEKLIQENRARVLYQQVRLDWMKKQKAEKGENLS